MPRIPVHIEVPIAEFNASLRVPLDLNLEEAQRLAQEIDNHASMNEADPSEAAKFAACDPNILPDITL